MRRALPLVLLLLPLSAAADEPIRTVPDPACAPAYAGTSGVIGIPADPGVGTATSASTPATPEQLASLPVGEVVFRSNTETFNRSQEFAARDGALFVRGRFTDETWRTMPVPVCLDGSVGEISVDGDTLLATDSDGWIYTLRLAAPSPLGWGAWTRRWGPFFWTDLGMRIPDDVLAWSASDLSADEDGTFTDRAGNAHEPFGILTVYLLRGDGRTVTTLDPWLPSDESREACTPGRSTTQIAGMSASGSTMAIVARDGTISTRLWEFDVAGANTVFYDYAWEDQTGVDAPKVQLPAPDWVTHAAPDGVITDRISLSKTFPAPTGRLIRIEGIHDGVTGVFEKTIDAPGWSFTPTGASLQGTVLPTSPSPALAAEDLDFIGSAGGFPAEILDLNPYCSPATLRLSPATSEPFDLILHTVDGLRQERRGRGFDTDPRGYRSAIEVPLELWEARAEQPIPVRVFLERWFPTSRFLDGPLVASRSKVTIGVPCWTFNRDDVADDPVASATRDMGAIFAGFMAAQEEGRDPSACTGIYGAP